MRLDLQTVGAVLGILVILAGMATTIVVYVRQGSDKALIQGLQTNSQMQDDRIKILTAENTTKDVRIHSLEEQVRVLTATVTNKAEVERILEMVERHHSESLEAWSKIMTEVKKR